MSKIIRLTAENVKRLKAVSIEPDGNVVIVGGNNGEGKTSLLDSIHMALGGKRAQCEEPIRRGANKAEIVCETEELTIARTITQKGDQLVVTGNDGIKLSSPQTILDKLASTLTFDPLAFLSMKPEKQLETVKMLVGLDFTEFDIKRDELYNRRRDVGKEAKIQKGYAEELFYHEDVPDEEIDVSELKKQLAEAQAHNNVVAQLNNTIVRFKSDVEQAKKDVASLQQQWADAGKRLSHLQFSLKSAQDDVEDSVNISEIQDKFSNAYEINQQIEANAAQKKANETLDEYKIQYDLLSKEIETIDNTKAELIEQAEFPINGMSFKDEQLYFNDFPFTQSSSAEQLKVSIAMGISMNPDLRILLIRDGSLLDEKSLAMVAQMAIDHDAQVWIERVGEGRECSVIIEDGQIRDQSIRSNK